MDGLGKNVLHPMDEIADIFSSKFFVFLYKNVTGI